MVSELQLSVVSFITSLVINYSLVMDLFEQFTATLNLPATVNIWDLSLSILVKPAELFIFLILPAPKRLVRLVSSLLRCEI